MHYTRMSESNRISHGLHGTMHFALILCSAVCIRSICRQRMAAQKYYYKANEKRTHSLTHSCIDKKENLEHDIIIDVIINANLTVETTLYFKTLFIDWHHAKAHSILLEYYTVRIVLYCIARENESSGFVFGDEKALK
jgi:hypothetical protein